MIRAFLVFRTRPARPILLGAYDMLSQTAFIDLYTNTIQQATAPIVSLILLIIGYNLKICLLYTSRCV